MPKNTILTAIAVIFATVQAPVFAYTQCTAPLLNVWVGDDGYIWLQLDNGGGSAYLTPNDPDTKNIYALALTALATGKQVTLRYSSDGVNCTAGGRGDVVGAYLNK